MTTFDIVVGIPQEFIERIRRLEHPGLMPLCLQIKTILEEENAAGLKAGTNSDGSGTAELMDSTWKRGRRLKGIGSVETGSKGFGPPRIPHFDRSWPIARFEVDIVRNGPTDYIIWAGWPTVPFAKYFQTGTKYMVARPIAGLRPSTRIQLQEAAHNFAEDLLKGNG